MYRIQILYFGIAHIKSIHLSTHSYISWTRKLVKFSVFSVPRKKGKSNKTQCVFRCVFILATTNRCRCGWNEMKNCSHQRGRRNRTKAVVAASWKKNSSTSTSQKYTKSQRKGKIVGEGVFLSVYYAQCAYKFKVQIQVYLRLRENHLWVLTNLRIRNKIQKNIWKSSEKTKIFFFLEYS